MFIQNLESCNHLPEINNGLLFREILDLRNQFLKCSFIAKLVNKVKVIDSFKHIKVLDNMWGTLNAGEDVDFVDYSILKLGNSFELFSWNHLHSYLFLCRVIYPFVYFWIHPRTQLRLQRIVFNIFSHRSIIFYAC